MGKELISQEWYKALLEELQAIIVESIFASRITILEGKWMVGKAICESPGYRKQQGKKGSFIQRVAKDLGRSQSDIYFCVQFYEQYPFDDFSNALEKLPEGKNISWNKMVNKYLSGKKDEPKPDRKYISCLVDLETKTIWIPSGYKDYSIRHKED